VCSRVEEGLGSWVGVEGLEERSFEGSWDQSTGEGYWVFHRRARWALRIVVVRRIRVVRWAGGRRRRVRRCLFVGLRVERKTSCWWRSQSKCSMEQDQFQREWEEETLN